VLVARQCESNCCGDEVCKGASRECVIVTEYRDEQGNKEKYVVGWRNVWCYCRGIRVTGKVVAYCLGIGFN
jgi:hypothetical protein